MRQNPNSNPIIQNMFSYVVIGFQFFAIIFIGAFARSDSTTLLSAGYLTSSLVLMLAFTLMYVPFKKLSLTAMVSLLLVIAVAIQSFLLFGIFWDSCFKGFNSWYQLNTLVLQRALYCAFALLLTCLDFIGIFGYWQIYILIAPVFTLGYGLNSAILNWGINIYDGGGGLQVFLFSGLVSLMIWAIVVRGNYQVQDHPREQSYFTRTLSIIGVVIALIAWPQFNAGGATVTATNTILTVSTSLVNSAYSNTFMGLCMALFTSMLMTSEGDSNKLRAEFFVNSFVNAGIIISSYQDVVLNPVACMVMTFLTTILTLIIYNQLFTPGENESEKASKEIVRIYIKFVFRIVLPLIGIIVTSIVVATRWYQTPALLVDGYSQKAGLEIAAIFITLPIGLVFGGIIAGIIKVYISFREGTNQKQQEGAEKKTLVNPARKVIDDDQFFNDMYEEMFPIYPKSSKPHAVVDQLNTQRALKMALIPDQTKVQKKNQEDQKKTSNSAKNVHLKNITKIQKDADATVQAVNNQQPISRNNTAERYSKGIMVMTKNARQSKIEQKQPQAPPKYANQYEIDSYESKKPQEEMIDNNNHQIHAELSAVVRKSRLEEDTVKALLSQQQKIVVKEGVEEVNQEVNESENNVNRKLEYSGSVIRKLESQTMQNMRLTK